MDLDVVFVTGGSPATIEASQDAVRAGGGTLLHGPSEIPGGEYSLTATDPQGAVFGLVGPRQ